MKKFALFITLLLLSACHPISTINTHDNEFNWGRSHSKPIYLSFKDTKTRPFYFLLNHDSKQEDFKLIVHWSNAKKGDILFNGLDSKLKFLINNSKIIAVAPDTLPRIVSYNLNSNTHEEEATFSISQEEFSTITFAKSVMVELTGRNNTVIATFNRLHTFKAFRDFMSNSY